ncbi:hypothetical protein GR925_09025 [Streptomyces sp. HUCO-GS316]|uniref:hypothetical protein n=1 Tax=Streptomyces sp. HUCO-GS316 TaxID=2692198 RepID=UPI00136C8083|nr:hypothetical protein [Streptomyces sp. HUCO-GS316]MXM63589.1 hypothetical protein [Streptomyces sp. HUCO-GS316]
MLSRHPTTYRSRRFLLREHDDEEQIVRLVAAEGWPRVADVPAKRFGSEPRRLTWEMVSGVFLTYLRDRKLRTAYLVVTSRTTSDLGSFASWITDIGLSVCTDDELLGALDDSLTVEEKSRALVRAGIGAPLNPDNRYSRAFIDSVSDVSPEVRKSGIMAIGHAEWKPFRELLDAVAQQDSNAQVRSLARRMAAAFDEAGIGDA